METQLFKTSTLFRLTLFSLEMAGPIRTKARMFKLYQQFTGSPGLMRISLPQFFKKIHKYVREANLGLFYYISAILWAKIAKKSH